MKPEHHKHYHNQAAVDAMGAGNEAQQAVSDAILTHRLAPRTYKWLKDRCHACGAEGDNLKFPCRITDQGRALSAKNRASHDPHVETTAEGLAWCSRCKSGEVELWDRPCAEGPAPQQNHGKEAGSGQEAHQDTAQGQIVDPSATSVDL